MTQLAAFGREEAASPTVEQLRALAAKFDSLLADAAAKARYVEACDNRSNGCGVDYGISYATDRFVAGVAKDRSRMSAAELSLASRSQGRFR